ncbi:GGDEF domain-containing protein, partial [Methylogaea oryzae]|uniref:GGDEF domain-containing protein n=1 Tax=Methylogaea oryzae TaxID=1295382 RepID=UPI0012E10C69
ALKHVAARLQAACRGKELPARQGGEEFVVLFERVGLAQALAAGERLRRAVESEPFATEGQLLRLTVSIGVAALDPRDGSFDDMLRRADDALYAAKPADAIASKHPATGRTKRPGAPPRHRQPQRPTPAGNRFNSTKDVHNHRRPPSGRTAPSGINTAPFQ